MSFGPDPWQQASWDWRAAGNFIGGGAGCGLLLFSAVSGVQGSLRQATTVLALVLVSLGLLCVWAEIGRPWRAMNVMFNPRSSWMSREAAFAPLLLGSSALWLAGQAWAAPLAALLALAFLYCQARILQAAKGIPAWREPLTVPLLVATGLAEGAGLFWLLAPWWGQGSSMRWGPSARCWPFDSCSAWRGMPGCRGNCVRAPCRPSSGPGTSSMPAACCRWPS